MRRPSPAPAPRSAAPPGRAATPGPPPRSAGSARPSGAAPAPSGLRPVPPRPPGPPQATRRRRRPILVAAALTLVILLGYGGYTAWNAITGSGSDGTGTGTEDATDYESIVARNIFLGAQVLGQGIDTRLVSDIGPFVDNANRVIYTMGLDRVAIGKLATGASGPQRDVISATQQSLDALQAALVQWRDVVADLRLGSVDDAHAAIDGAIARLQGDLERWRSVTSAS